MIVTSAVRDSPEARVTPVARRVVESVVIEDTGVDRR